MKQRARLKDIDRALCFIDLHYLLCRGVIPGERWQAQISFFDYSDFRNLDIGYQIISQNPKSENRLIKAKRYRSRSLFH